MKKAVQTKYCYTEEAKVVHENQTEQYILVSELDLAARISNVS